MQAPFIRAFLDAGLAVQLLLPSIQAGIRVGRFAAAGEDDVRHPASPVKVKGGAPK